MKEKTFEERLKSLQFTAKLCFKINFYNYLYIM